MAEWKICRANFAVANEGERMAEVSESEQAIAGHICEVASKVSGSNRILKLSRSGGMVDALDSKSSVAIRGGSSPLSGTKS